MQFTDRKTHFTDRIPLLLIPKVRMDRHITYTDRYGAGVLDNPQTSAFGLFEKLSNFKFSMRVDFWFSYTESLQVLVLVKRVYGIFKFAATHLNEYDKI